MNDNFIRKKDICLNNYMENGALTELEAVIHLDQLINCLKLYFGCSAEKYFFSHLNSYNIKITRFLDLIINYVNLV